MQMQNGQISQWEIVKMCKQKIKSHKKFSSMSPLPTIAELNWKELLESPKCRSLSVLTYFNKQPVYKQLALEWQMAR